MHATEPTEWKKTACIICALNCGLEVQTDGRCIVRIRGDKAHPVSKGYVCEKSQRMDYYQNGADRLESPMRRRPDGTYEAIDWETAIHEIAAKFAAIKATIGLRVTEEEELAGLDISTHGMYGYPESFIPREEYPAGQYQPTVAGTPIASPMSSERSATGAATTTSS